MMTRYARRHAVLLTTAFGLSLSVPALAAPTKPAEPENPAKPAKPSPGPDAKRGRDVFEVQRCGSCHAVSAEGIGKRPPPGLKLPPDLSGVGARRSEAWLRAWLQQRQLPDDDRSKPGRRHAVAFRGSDRDLGDLIAWLLILKTPASTRAAARSR